MIKFSIGGVRSQDHYPTNCLRANRDLYTLNPPKTSLIERICLFFKNRMTSITTYLSGQRGYTWDIPKSKKYLFKQDSLDTMDKRKELFQDFFGKNALKRALAEASRGPAWL